MMFAYVIYVPLLACIAVVCYHAGGPRAVYDYLLSFALVNIICSFGFILFPVASPLFHSPEKYTVPLQGGFFTWCGEWIRNNMHYAGGSLPSPHCAVGTVMMAMLYRYRRLLWHLSLPVFLTIYAATVYCRYHYVWDSIAGIIVGALVLRFSPAIVNVVNPLTKRSLHTADPGCMQPAGATLSRNTEP
jgi:membrane-associated phospholipid phosphatase